LSETSIEIDQPQWAALHGGKSGGNLVATDKKGIHKGAKLRQMFKEMIGRSGNKIQGLWRNLEA